MHPLHDYVARQLADRLKSRKVVVWYDPRGEFAPFIEEIRSNASTDTGLTATVVGGMGALLAEYRGSMLEMRSNDRTSPPRG